MKHLSGMDAAFLHLESPEMPMHIGSLNVLDLPQGYSGDFFEAAKTHLMERMHLADVFTRKLALMPFDLSNPVWVEDEDIDMDYHVRHVTLPAPGTNRQLQQYVARLHSSLLDRSRPLWEFFLIDGLKSGQVGLYTKVHHAGLDGQAGVALAAAVFDVSAAGRAIKPPRPRPRRNQYQLGVAELLSAALQNTAQQVVKLIQTLPVMVSAAKSLLPQPNENGKRDWSLPKANTLFAPKTPLNVAITNQRTFAGRTVPLSEIKQIAKITGTSVNDVVMATVSGGLRKYLKGSNELPERSLSAAVPISLREAGDSTANNQVSMITMTLATHLSDPMARLLAISEAATSTKAKVSNVKAALPTDFPMLAAPWLMSGAASLFGRSRLANVMPPLANVVISNVAGIPVQLYFAGATMVSYYPVSIPAHTMALNVTVQSYNGRMDYGLIACRRALPDINDLADMMLAEHRVLLELALAKLAATAVQSTKAPTAPVPVAPLTVANAKAKAQPKAGAGKAESTSNAAKPKLKLVSPANLAKPRKVAKSVKASKPLPNSAKSPVKASAKTALKA